MVNDVLAICPRLWERKAPIRRSLFLRLLWPRHFTSIMRAEMKPSLALALLAASGPLMAQAYGPVAPAGSAAATPAASPPPAAISAELGALAAKAADTHPSVEAARANVRAAGGDLRAAKWQRGPSVSVEALTFEGGAPVVRGDNFSANLVVDQPIWQGGRIGGTIDRAKAVQRYSEAQADETMFDIELRVTNAYYDTVRATRRAMILDRGLTEHRMLVESISRRVEQEVSPRVDLELARSRTAQLEEQLATATAQRDASLQRLRELIGDPGYTLAAIPFYDPAAHHPNSGTAIEEATSCSPTRKRAQAEALVARADVKLAQSQYMPRVSAVFSSNEVTGERVGVVFRAGTNGGLSQFEAASAARQRRQAAELQVGAAERDLRDAINADIAENLASRQRIVSSGEAASASRAVTDSYQRQFVVGRRSWLDVMNAALETTQAELSADDAEVTAMASAARLSLRTCRWQPQPTLSRP